MLAIEQTAGVTRVLVVPITRSAPQSDEPAVEIPEKVKAHLGLDHERSWIILSEANIDAWPSPDMRQIPGRPGIFEYGLIPAKLLEQIRSTIRESLRDQNLALVKRDEP